jgi:hypothetical protein
MWVRRPLPPRRPYSRVLIASSRRHLRIRLEAKCIPPLGALSSDIECRATRFVAAGCLPLSKLPYSASRGQERLFHSARPRRLWKTLSQHLSFGATIRATQGCECAGMNRHVVGDERALQKRSSDSTLTLILRSASRGVRRSVERGIGGPGD